jgi:serpin B
VALRAAALAALAASSLLSLDCASAPPSAPAPAGVASTSADVAAASNAFGFDLFAHLKPASESVIFSPFSAAVALNMAAAGARGQTRTEMLGALSIDPKHAAGAYASLGSVLAALNARDGTAGLALHVADRLWGQSGVAFKPDFLALLRDSYGAPLEAVDFAGAPEAARAAINQWVATQTRGHVRGIPGDGDITPATDLVLTNAIYFKGTWEKPFPLEATLPRRFGGVSTVPMMAQWEEFDYTRDDGVQVIELPYRGDLSMVVVLPDGANDLPAVERKLALNCPGWVAALRPDDVDLWLPRWTIATWLDLGGPLQEAGMRLALTRAADFLGHERRPALHRQGCAPGVHRRDRDRHRGRRGDGGGGNDHRTLRPADGLPRRPPILVFGPRPEDGGGAVLGAGDGVGWVTLAVTAKYRRPRDTASTSLKDYKIPG